VRSGLSTTQGEEIYEYGAAVERGGKTSLQERVTSKNLALNDPEVNTGIHSEKPPLIGTISL
jgi:hypothetical protein